MVLQHLASWNVEGLNLDSGTKLHELQTWMVKRSIGVLCMQETHITGAQYFYDNGFLVILSGAEGDGRSYAGVGFIVAPDVCSSVSGFLQKNDRLASLRLRVRGGQVCLVTAYAPTNTANHPFHERYAWYTSAVDFIQSQRTHGPSIVMGDFNARVHSCRPGEETCVGRFAFGDPTKTTEPTDNRELLIEMCHTLSACLANTFFEHPKEELVTYRSLGVPPLAPVSATTFAQLDFTLVSADWLKCVQDIRCHRQDALRSQHFPQVLDVDIQIEKVPPTQVVKMDLQALGGAQTNANFCNEFVKAVDGTNHLSEDVCLEELSATVTRAMHEASSCLPKLAAQRKNPWIGQSTLELIESRNLARSSGDYFAEKDFNRRIKASARSDRKIWLSHCLASGDWSAIRKLRTKPKICQGRLRDMTGNLVSSDRRPETLAEYLEQIQWAVKFPEESPQTTAMFNSDLEIDTGSFSHSELRKVTRSLRSQRACGHDGVQPEF